MVGGDYYDFIYLGFGRVALALGDIAGNGVPAALMMASLRAILRIQSATLADDLPRLLRWVNRLFCDRTEMDCFASLFLDEYRDRGRTLRYANCGHNPPMILHSDLTMERLEATATIIGTFLDWNCTIREVALARGDTLAFYTDGVTEGMNESGEEFGEGRLLESLKMYRAYSRGVDVLRGITFDVGAGEVVGLLGKNGAGKTTPIRIAMGMIEAQKGHARVFGLCSIE